MKWLWLSLLLLAPMTAAAQQPSIHQHPAVPADTIDGSKTPTLIPDSTAWRLWMLSVTSKDPTHPELDQQREDAYLRAAGYEEDELPVMRAQLYSFRTAYDTMIAEHNRGEAANQHPSLDALKAKRDTLVKASIDGMLAAKHYESVQVFVKGQKRFMRIPKIEGVQ